VRCVGDRRPAWWRRRRAGEPLRRALRIGAVDEAVAIVVQPVAADFDWTASDSAIAAIRNGRVRHEDDVFDACDRSAALHRYRGTRQEHHHIDVASEPISTKLLEEVHRGQVSTESARTATTRAVVRECSGQPEPPAPEKTLCGGA